MVDIFYFILMSSLYYFRLRLFWRKTISGNDFTPHRVFGCTWKIEFFGNQFHLTVCFMALTRKLVYIFIFTSKHFRVSNAEREKEEKVANPPKTDRTLAQAPPAKSHPSTSAAI